MPTSWSVHESDCFLNFYLQFARKLLISSEGMIVFQFAVDITICFNSEALVDRFVQQM